MNKVKKNIVIIRIKTESHLNLVRKWAVFVLYYHMMGMVVEVRAEYPLLMFLFIERLIKVIFGGRLVCFWFCLFLICLWAMIFEYYFDENQYMIRKSMHLKSNEFEMKWIRKAMHSRINVFENQFIRKSKYSKSNVFKWQRIRKTNHSKLLHLQINAFGNRYILKTINFENQYNRRSILSNTEGTII